MNVAVPRLAVCICTYQRPALLGRLVADILGQGRRPDALIVVDGDPASGQARSVLEESAGAGVRIVYQPSDHPNQPYQRYLGWRVAARESVDILLYFDDDIRLLERETVEKIILPFSWADRRVAGVTAQTLTPRLEQNLAGVPALLEQKQASTSALARRFGEGTRTRPGGLTASGHRVEADCAGTSYARVDCLRGRVMAFRMTCLSRANFPDDLFAIKHARLGMGEDTLISHSVLSSGELLTACEARIEHPDDELPNSYPHQAFDYGIATSYSRRLLNDYFRFPRPPLTRDRLALLRSYAGNLFLNWWNFFRQPRAYRLQFARGYSVGVWRAIVRPPRARTLTPHIDWEADAERALASRVNMA